MFKVPDNVPTGCAVPLLVQIGSEISNNTVMPVANGTRNCTPNNPALASVNVEQAVTVGPVTYGSIKLFHDSDGNGTFEDDAKAQFVKIATYNPGTQPFFVSWSDDLPLGTCMALNNLNQSEGSVASIAPLDAGPSSTITGPNGNAVLANNEKTAQFNAAGTFLIPGDYTVTGNGGADVGSYTADITIPAPVKLVSPVNNSAVTRSSGLNVSWTGGSGNIQILVNSCSDNPCDNGAAAICFVAASPGTFTIPPYMLEALPAGNSAGIVLTSYMTAPFKAQSLDLGVLQAYTNDGGFGFGWGSGGFTLK